jgi:CubicO group peptidase (beta-lactamase class C family)
MKSASFLIPGAALLAFSGPALAVPQDFSARADEIVAEAWPADGPGAAIIVTEDGKPVYAKGWGLADVEAHKPITPDTVFRMGSITKQFASAVVLQLAAEGKLSLDDPLSKFIPDFPQPGASATVRQLLNHTSGIQSYTDIPGWMVEANTDKAYTTEQLIAVFKDLPPTSKPGENWAYNNSGYVLVGAVIEKVTGKPWHEVVDERIAKPLGLTTIRYGGLESQTPGMATGYTEHDGKTVSALKINMSVPNAAGALIGSVEDLAKWNSALNSGKVVPQAYYAQMTAPTALPGGKTDPYGFGISNRDLRGRDALGHGGGIFGFSTDSIYIPKDGVFVAVFSNSDSPRTSPGMVMLKLAALAVGDPFPTFEKTAIDPGTIEPWFGVYAIDAAERRFFARDGKLYTQRTGGSELEVFAAGDNRFFYDNTLSWFEISRDEAGVPVMAMHQQGEAKAEISKRTGAIPPPAKAAEVSREILQVYVGDYAVGGAMAVVLLADDGLTVKLGEQPTLRLIPRSTNEFSVEGVDAKVVFNGSAGGAAKSMTIHQGGRTMEAPRAK